MRKLIKFLKPYAGVVFAVLCVLVVQAYCDLSLPTYTSDIVNIGIQQSGVDEKVPLTIAEEDLNHLLLFVHSDDQETVKNSYEKSEQDYDYDGTVLELKESVEDNNRKMDDLASILGKPMLLTEGFDSGSDTTKQMEEQMKSQMEEQMQQVPDISQMSIYDLFGMME